MTPGTSYLLERLVAVEERIRGLVARRRETDPQPEDPFRGLYVDDAMIDQLASRPSDLVPEEPSRSAAEERADRLEAAGAELPLRTLARTFDLDPLDVELLLVALACEVDPRLELLFGYLNDDVTRRRPTVAVALALCGHTVASSAARFRVQHGLLVEGGLITLDEPDRPLPSRCLRVPDRVVDHLLGSAAPDAQLREVLLTPEVIAWGDPGPLTSALAGGARLVHLREPATGSGRLLAMHALAALRRPALLLDATALAAHPHPEELARVAVRESRLSGAGLVLCDVEALGAARPVLRRLLDPRACVIAVGATSWDPSWCAASVLQLAVPESTAAERMQLWHEALDLPGLAGELTRELAPGHPDEFDPTEAASPFRLRPEQVTRAARTARQLSVLDGALTADHVRQGALGENSSTLDRLARRIRPAVGWDDLVLPEPVTLALKEISLRARFREQVLGDWRMRPGGGRGVGVAALFAGDSGTGKTMSAEVVAHDLGLELFVVDLATVVDKYIGETEKNLERIFAGATGVNAVLLFDEADAIFGRRTEVRDSHDRYANIESAYLLQRMESFDGLCILATNLRANIDEAFTRRLDVLVDFPLPDAEHRLALWDRALGRTIPRRDDVDLEFCARAFDLAGGAIRSASVTAAYLAAADGGVLGMGHVVSAVHREYRKLGRLTLEHEFGPYWALLS